MKRIYTRSMRRLARSWRNERGMQMAEKIAAIMVMLALLAAVAAAFVGNGGTVGQTASATISSFITGGAGTPQGGSGAPGQATPGQVEAGVLGLPNTVQNFAAVRPPAASSTQEEPKKCKWYDLVCHAKKAASWVADKASAAWNWVAGKASDAWNWVEDHATWFGSAALAFIVGLVVGIVAIVVIVVVAVVIAVAFGLEIAAVLAVVGAIALIAALGYGIYQRWKQFAALGKLWYAYFALPFLAVSDLIGLTGIIEGITGKDIITGDALGQREAGSRFGSGLAALVLTIALLFVPGPKGEPVRGVEPGERPPVAGRPVEAYSFSGWTPVATSTGWRAIRDLRVGDDVLAFYATDGSTSSYPVTAVHVHRDPTLVTLRIDGEQIETTPEHPFLTSEGWVAAGDLQPGSQVRSASATYGTMQQVTTQQRSQNMYNLTVADAHTFFVGHQNWLVHNVCIRVGGRQIKGDPIDIVRESPTRETLDALLAKDTPLSKSDWRTLIDNPPAGSTADDIRYLRYLQEKQQAGQQALGRNEWQQQKDRLEANTNRGRQDEDQTLTEVGIDNNNYTVGANGEPRSVVTYESPTLKDANGNPVTTRPDAVTDKYWIDVKSVSQDSQNQTYYNTDQLRAQKEGAAAAGKKSAVILTSEADTPRPSGPLSQPQTGADIVYLRQYTRNPDGSVSTTWYRWDVRANNGDGGWVQVTEQSVQTELGGG